MNNVVAYRDFALYALLTALMALNRETGGVLVILYGVMLYERKWGHLARFTLLLTIYVSIQIGLHLILGSAPHVLGILGTFQYNLATWQDAAYESLILLPLLIMAIRGYPTAPPLYKRLLWVAALYGVAIIIGGAWNESQRLIIPLMPLLLPLVLHTETKS